MPKKDRTLHDDVRNAAVNLRVAGLSERAVYERFRDLLKEPPSYRDLRAAYADAGVRTRAQAKAARDNGRYVGKEPPVLSEYRERRDLALAVDKTSDAREAFDRRYALGYLGREDAPQTLLDDANEEDYLSYASIQRDEGS